MIAAIWLGSAVFLMLAASAVFRAVPDSTTAADSVGAMLTRWHYIALSAPLLLFAFELRRARRLILSVLFAGVLLAAAQVFVDLRIRAMRTESIIPMSSLDRTDPVRRRFGALHGASMTLLLLQAIAAAVVVGAREKKEVLVSEDERVYKVVVNSDGQHSIWPADRENALGWSDAGFQGTKAECLEHVQQTSGGGP